MLPSWHAYSNSGTSVAPERHHDRVRRREDGRIGDRELLRERVGIEVGELLDQVHVRPGAPALPASEVRGLNDQRLALKVSA